MNKKIIFMILSLIVISSTFGSASATSVFLTSDHIGSEDNDVQMLESIKTYIEELSNNQITVEIDSQAPGPGEGTRAISSDSDVSVNLAACCAGNLLILAKYSQDSQKQIIFVNTGDFDLDEDNYLRRAWDDNYSSQVFAGITNPGDYLKASGISYIQPLKQYPDASHSGSYTSSNDEVNKYIAQQIIEKINSYDSSNKGYDSSLIKTHSLNPSVMAQASSQLTNSESDEYNDTYNGYTASQLLYLTSSYLNGNGLESPQNYENPDSPLKYSLLTKDSYKISEYMEMAGIVKDYMDTNNKAPDYINYNGAYISYYDLEYNFAKITENHTDSSSMGFDNSYHFDKVHESLLINLFPVIIVALILLLVYLIYRRIRRKRRNRRRRY